MKTLYCDFDGCIVTPAFNFKGCSYGLYCSEHKKENMINVKNGSMTVKECKKEEWITRLNTLSQTFDYWIENRSEKTINLIYLFYDTK